jgi:hypothetical protein
MKNFKKNDIKKLLLIVVVGVISLSVIWFIHFCFFSGFFPPPFDKYAATEFAPEFSWEKYESVTAGQTEQEIKEIFGEPLWIRYVNKGSEKEIRCLRYSEGKEKPIFMFDFEYYKVEICVNSSGFVTTKGVHLW